jgi:hypothetical protein
MQLKFLGKEAALVVFLSHLPEKSSFAIWNFCYGWNFAGPILHPLYSRSLFSSVYLA